ncbi:hypothetical protein ATCC90586_007162 [Pythium insidiosum]|nr:hypothetical protein ATCC90586_007162 [Pythium insidiosum]
MGTAELDHGVFWQLGKLDAMTQLIATSALALIAAIYISLLITLLQSPVAVANDATKAHNHGGTVDPILRLPSSRLTQGLSQLNRISSKLPSSFRQRYSSLSLYGRELITHDGRYRKVWNLLLEIPELALQTLSLWAYTREGVDQRLVIAYASLVALNCSLTFYHVQIGWRASALHEIISDAMLDVVFAVFFPAAVLFFSAGAFRGDLETLKVQQRFFPPSVFQRSAQIYADPRQIALFTSAFESLRIQGVTDLLSKLSFNVLTCLRWRQIVVALQRRRCVGPHGNVIAEVAAIAPVPNSAGTSVQVQRVLRYPRRVVPVFVGYVFLAFGVSVLVLTVVAVRRSTTACQSFPPCVLFKYDVRISRGNETCHCIAFVDRVLAQDSASWTNAADATPALAQLAELGTLQTVEVVNQRLSPALPDEMRSCKQLRKLVLINTEIRELPSWAGEVFTQLHTLHIEGKRGATNLVALPLGIFDRMGQLRRLHLTLHRQLRALPRLGGLRSLEVLYISNMDRVDQLLGLDSLPKLHTLGIERLLFLRSLPDISSLGDTLQDVHIQTTSLCCSGFLQANGQCNRTHPDCVPPRPTDLGRVCYIQGNSGPVITAPSRALLQPFIDRGSVCDLATSAAFAQERAAQSLLGHVDECRGVLYKQCAQGICYNPDMEEVQCIANRNVIEMRKLAIRRGAKCDRRVEAWLGCGT